MLGKPTIESLKALLQTLPGRALTLHVLFVYDTEDPPVVDLRPQRAFFSQAAAEKAADWIERGSKKRRWRVGYGTESVPAGYGTVVRQFEIKLDWRNTVVLPPPIEHTDMEDGEFFVWATEDFDPVTLDIIGLLRGDDTGWRQTLTDCFGAGSIEPDFEAGAPQGKVPKMGSD